MAEEDDFDLGEYNDAFAGASETSNRGEADEDGNYPDDVKLEGDHASVEGKIELFKPKKKDNGKKSFLWKIRVTDGECKGQIAWKESAISHDAIEYLKQELAICGLRLGVTPGFEQLADLPKKEIRNKLLGVHVIFKQAVVGGFNRVYINKRVEKSGASTRQAQPSHPAAQQQRAVTATKPSGGAMRFCAGCGEKFPGEELDEKGRCKGCEDIPF